MTIYLKNVQKKEENVHTFFVLCFSPLLGLFSRLTMKTGRVDKARRERVQVNNLRQACDFTVHWDVSVED